jgi:kynureninase
VAATRDADGRLMPDLVTARGTVDAAGLAAERAHFPIFAERTYLASHCLGPLHVDFDRDLADYRDSLARRTRGIDEWVERVEEVRAALGRLVGAPADDLTLGASATACQATLAAALRPTKGRAGIVVTDLDFRSARYLWEAQTARGFSVETVRSVDGIAMPREGLLEAIDERVAVVAVSLVSYFNGALLDLAPVIERAHRCGALVIVDAYQALGVVPVDVLASGVDALVGGTHKWLSGGGTGLAFAYVRRALADTLEPAYPGWLGHDDAPAYEEAFRPAAGARRFDQGTPAMEAIYTARAGLRFVERLGVAALSEASRARGDQLIQLLDEQGFEVRTPRDRSARGGMICVAAAQPREVAAALRTRGIDIDTRPGTGLRVSPHALTTPAEIALFVDELSRLRAHVAAE